MKYWMKGTPVNRTLVWGLISFWLGFRLCLLIAVAVVSEAKISF